MNIFREIVEDLFYKFVVPTEFTVIRGMLRSPRRWVYLLILFALLAGMLLYRFGFLLFK